MAWESSHGDIVSKLNSLSLIPGKGKIIVAVDYGTTFTEAAYVNSSSDVNIIATWRGTGRDAVPVFKTPSCIAYPEENENKGKQRWGFQAGPGYKCYSWTKLLLDKNVPLTKYDDPKLKQAVQSGIMELPPGKDAVMVVADFLASVYEHIMDILEKGLTKPILDISKIEFWFTMPAIWSDKAQAATKEAAQRAGFGPRPGRLFDTIHMITEPEAAAIAALATLTRSQSDVVSALVKSGDGVLVCDCGGGTVVRDLEFSLSSKDITTYLITKTEPQLSFEELCIGTGGKCGSTALDRNLYKLMAERFGPAFDAIPAKRKGPGSAFMRHFEIVKEDFGLNEKETTHELPLRMEASQVDPQYYDDEEGVVFISNRDLRDIFDPVINQIVDLIKTQVVDANKEMATGTINRIILVGGFGYSEYLRQKVREAFDSVKSLTITIPSNPQSTIVHGAALRGLYGIRPTAKRCRRNYGFIVSKPFREGIDDEKHSFWDEYSNRKMVRGRTEWLINKGQKYTEDDSKIVNVSRQHRPSDSLKRSRRLYSCDLVDSPERIDLDYFNFLGPHIPGVRYVGDIVIDFTEVELTKFESKIISGERVYLIKYSLKVVFGAHDGILKFEAISEGKVIGKTNITFSEASYY